MCIPFKHFFISFSFGCSDADDPSVFLQMGFVLGLGLAVVVGVGLRFGSSVFSKDVNVQHIIFVGIPVMLS